MDRTRKDISVLFKSGGLSITIETKRDRNRLPRYLEMCQFFPYKKLNSTPLYIHSESDHSPFITKQLPSMTNRCTSNLSRNENEFNNAKLLMKFEAPFENARQNRNKKVIWFNPRDSLNVQTNIDTVFLKLLRKYFPRSHKFNKIFNVSAIKISYSLISENVVL